MLKTLWLRYLKWYLKYSEFPKRNKKEALFYFRDKLFVSILILTLSFSIVTYLPSAIMAVLFDKWIVLFISSFTFLVILFLFFNKKLSLKAKKMIFSINFFVLSFVLLIELGFNGNGTIFLFMLSILITLFSGRKAGIISVLISAFIYIMIVVAFNFQWLQSEYFIGFATEEIFIVFFNNIIITSLTVFSVSFLIDQLHKALMKETQLQKKLIKKHKKVIVAKERAEQSDQLKSAFLANMSHEVGTPMYGILGCAQFLKSYNAEDEEYQEYVSVIETNGNELLDLITDILSISKIESGLMDIKKSRFNANEVIDTIYSLYLSRAESKGLNLKVNNFISNETSVIDSDVEKFTVILKHLVENAIKYTANGSVNLTCSTNSNFSQLTFSIKDTGIGIANDKLKSVFNSFYQVDISNKNALHGSGVGLSIAKAYIKMLGGNLLIESKENKGTTMSFAIDTNLKNV